MHALETKLRAAGLADTAIAIGATIRPATLVDTLSATLAAPAATAPLARALPRLSVDLRHSLGAPAAGTPDRTTKDLEVRGLIGEGGMGRVLLARQHSLERDVAVKTAKEGAPEAIRNALLVEGVITGRLEHPAIVPVHALGLDEQGRPAMVMKRIEGVEWRALALDAAHPGWEGWPGDDDDRLLGHLQIFVQICNAVHFAHSRGIVHRDIKLENVLIGRYGDVYLADWGIATSIGTAESHLCGTPGYMAPEMVDGRAVDERTDVYLLGATLHEALTGKLRHPAVHALQALLLAKLSEPHVYGDEVPTELGDLINRACHVDADQRPAGASALREAIVRYLEHRASAALAAEAIERLERVEPLLALATPDDAQRGEIERLIAESSFALERALADWPGDEASHAASERLAAIVAERRARAAALEREAHERDPMVGTKTRAVALTALAFVGLGIAAFSVVQTLDAPKPIEVVAYPLSLYLCVLAGTVLMRKRLFVTRFNRESIAVIHVLLILMVLGRVLGFFVHIDLAEHFARDSFMFAGGFAVAAFAYRRWIAWIALLLLVSFALCTVMPAHALGIFTVAASLSSLIAAGFQWADRS